LTAEHALADGRGGITTRITALYVLGYLAMGRGDDAGATALLDEALAAAEPMGELQRISPPLWGLAEAALLRGDNVRAVALCERGFDLSHAVRDAAYLFPFVVTGTRARLALLDPHGAAEWVARVEAALRHRSIPGTLPAVTHAGALIQLAGGDRDRARAGLSAAAEAWAGRRRFWEGSWARLDEARCARDGRRTADATSLSTAVRGQAELAGATTLVVAADGLLDRSDQRSQQPWHPLSAREYDVALLVVDGMTNREIAARLVVSPKTVAAHIEHILSKLGAARRTEIAAWATRLET
jgi:DNA-binding CsgD family transcriptional regulator